MKIKKIQVKTVFLLFFCYDDRPQWYYSFFPLCGYPSFYNTSIIPSL
ncbi:protein of unknown function [Legionella fallonii LLAP-10]|uniref:Uncharacterized protein n=1 Tax=Legionella fallonii LLAP-10 TaxID=1212491 RepID=A0A098G2V1_9GAMM|nr:protein of unknown function [Legionella fallonii LLAP-10]